MTVIDKAKLFAFAAHAAIGQERKYTNEPYIVHPAEVAAIVDNVQDRTDDMVAAAWLHDVVEDTCITQDMIEQTFGINVAQLVYWVTDISRPNDGNRKYRKTIDRNHIANAPAAAQTIKLADLISNARSITLYDPSFTKVYMEEKRLLLRVLHRGDGDLWTRANAIVREYELTEASVSGRRDPYGW